MHAWLCENPVGVEALNWKEMPTPVPQSGQVLIRIEAASLNFPDLLIVQNKYQMKPDLPFVPGSEYAGVIEAVGEDVTHLKVGQSVACLSGTGNLVILKHNNTYLTAYAHNQTLLVKEDQSVTKGQRIADMGSSDSDRVKLHFEIRKQGKPVDPSKLLPARP